MGVFQNLLPECTIDEGRHKTNGQQTEGVICPQGSTKKPLASFATSRFNSSYPLSQSSEGSGVLFGCG